MEYLVDWAFAAVGIITVGIYEGLIYEGAMPGSALLTALGGGVVLGILLRVLILAVSGPGDDEEHGLARPLVTAQATAQPGKANPANVSAHNAEHR